MPLWLLALIALLNALATVGFLLKGNWAFVLICLGAVLVNLGLILAARTT